MKPRMLRVQVLVLGLLFSQRQAVSSVVRVVNGNGPCSGRVEVSHSGEWGTVCGEHWNLANAEVVCKQLRCGTAVSASGNACFKEGRGTIWRDYKCKGTESSIISCAAGKLSSRSCSHSEDGGVVCSKAPLKAPQLQITPPYSAFMVGEKIRIDCNAPTNLCVKADFRIYRDGQSISNVMTDHIHKGMYANRTIDTTYNGNFYCDYTYIENTRAKSPKSNTVVITVVSLPSPNISIRPSGMVNWGQKVDIICSISTQHLGGEFTLIKLFGYFRERKSAVGNSATFTIVQMDFSREGDYFCLYETLVSNRTFISKGSTTVKVTLDDELNIPAVADSALIRLAGGPDRCAGRLEVNLYGKWGTVCDDYWHLENAEVVCRQLDCGSAVGASAEACFKQGRGPIWRDYNCQGSEKFITNCTIERHGARICDHSEDVGVVCSASVLITPVITIIPPHSVFMEGEKIQINCSTGSRLCVKVNYRMYHNGLSFSSTNSDRMQTEMYAYKGSYYCDYSYTENESLKSPRSNIINITVVTLPTPSISFKPSQINWGQTVQIICSISTQNMGGAFTLQKLNATFREKKLGQFVTFTIDQVDFTHNGYYFCQYETKVANRAFISNQSESLQLSVEVLLSSPSITFKPSRKAKWGEKVDIVCSISSQHLGGTFILEKVSGSFKETVETAGTSATFTIAKVDFSHAGLYFCQYLTTVSNHNFSSSSTPPFSNLSVEVLLAQPSISISAPNGGLSWGPQGPVINRGHSFSITCSTQSQYPGGSFNLIFSGSNTSKTELAVNHSATFNVHEAFYSNQGNYSCIYTVAVANLYFSSVETEELVVTIKGTNMLLHTKSAFPIWAYGVTAVLLLFQLVVAIICVMKRRRRGLLEMNIEYWAMKTYSGLDDNRGEEKLDKEQDESAE